MAALKGIDLRVGPGEVVGLVGDNGAGKSTLMKVVVGALTPDGGEILVDGVPVSFAGIRDARKHGIEMLYQDLALCDDLDVAQNFFLGRTPTRFGLVNVGRMHAHVRRQLEELRHPAQVDPGPCPIPVRGSAPVAGHRQGRVVQASPPDPRRAHSSTRCPAIAGCPRPDPESPGRTAVVLISHRLRDILDVCDRIVVLYEGRKVANLEAADTTLEEVVTYIVTDPDAARTVARLVS